jgi:hypothetical protein
MSETRPSVAANTLDPSTGSFLGAYNAFAPSHEVGINGGYFIPSEVPDLCTPDSLGLVSPPGSKLRVVAQISSGSEFYEDGRAALLELTDQTGSRTYAIQGLTLGSDGGYNAQDNPGVVIGGSGSLFALGGNSGREHHQEGFHMIQSGTLWNGKGGYSFNETKEGLLIDILDHGIAVRDRQPGRSKLIIANGQDVANNHNTVPDPAYIQEAGIEATRCFEVGGVTYNILGGAYDGPYGVYVLESIGRDGKRHTFGVYQSKSEGGWRVTTGYTEDNRYSKGREDVHGQYTQDTQLHPDFLEGISVILGDADTADPFPVLSHKQLELTRAEEDAVLEEFRKSTTVYGFNNQQLNNLLAVVPAGWLDKAGLKQRLGGVPDDQLSQSMNHYIQQLNTSLENSGVVPDFSSRPKRTATTQHEVLGVIQTEVFEADGIEWYMSTDKDGNTWIDRVRFADSQPTCFGTDSTLVYSGILTSKPLEYQKQADGIDPKYVRPSDSKYVNITPFLATLYPIKAYMSAKKTAKMLVKGREG